MTEKQRKQALLNLFTRGIPDEYLDNIASLAEFINLVNPNYVYNPGFLLSYAAKLESHIDDYKCKLLLYSYLSKAINSHITSLSSVLFDNSILYKINSKLKELNGPIINRLDTQQILNTGQISIRVETDDDIVFLKKYTSKNHHVNQILKHIRANSKKKGNLLIPEIPDFCDSVIKELEDYIKTRKGEFTSW